MWWFDEFGHRSMVWRIIHRNYFSHTKLMSLFTEMMVYKSDWLIIENKQTVACNLNAIGGSTEVAVGEWLRSQYRP